MEQVFHSERISFVKVSEELINDYLELVVELARSAGQTEYNGPTLNEERAFVKKTLETNAPLFSMLEIHCGEFIGNIEFVNALDNCAELSIAIAGQKQDMHYGTEAVGRMVDYGFREMGLKKIILRVRPENKRAIHIYEKCGFVKYGEDDKYIFMKIEKGNLYGEY